MANALYASKYDFSQKHRGKDVERASFLFTVQRSEMRRLKVMGQDAKGHTGNSRPEGNNKVFEKFMGDAYA